MSLADHTRSIIALAWARMIGLGDEELLGAGSHHEVIAADGSAVAFLRLFDHTVLSGPAEVLRHARRRDDAELADERRLLELSRRHAPGARSLGAANLLYAEEPAALGAAQRGAVSFDPEHVRAVLAASPADDVQASGIAAAPWSAALVDEGTGTALGAAGRELWAGMLGQLGVLTVPDQRRAGVGLQLAAVAAEEAFSEGLVPQWRARTESVGSLRIAAALGFSPAGSQTTVVFD
ncbi:GNAT family N-acetyltransferase [Nesterenkonia sp. AY15]|uniref:GNAT family N-acetyltransferase n=1 Tax=Nesterenkonia sp. AY15 TaxID=2901139 RepID=UPI001F4CBDC6|nr:GNAT family N-acetyltransferase [Nesterenkonia sp. AY15]MCH8570664.1 GNAT family N-acetyltransferase [Nesterenkonia sp. AY15]